MGNEGSPAKRKARQQRDGGSERSESGRRIDPSPITHHPSRPRIQVAAAVILREGGQFLLGQRPAGKAYAGYWEFPGGKVEPGELPLPALARELHEELGIDVELAYPWLTRDYDYEHAAVRLRFYRVVRWSGTLTGRESQIFSWESSADVRVAPLLPANAPIMRALRLPPVYGITHAGDFGPGVFMTRLEKALKEGLRLLQVREKGMPGKELASFLADVVRQARRYGARVLVNGSAELAQQAGADGVHLPARQLMALDRRPALELVGASCHNDEELARAVSAETDFVVLGPVRTTPSHRDTPGIGWERFARLIEGYPLPVYALGGLTRSDMETAWRAGAHGISMMRGAWPPI